MPRLTRVFEPSFLRWGFGLVVKACCPLVLAAGALCEGLAWVRIHKMHYTNNFDTVIQQQRISCSTLLSLFYLRFLYSCVHKRYYCCDLTAVPLWSSETTRFTPEQTHAYNSAAQNNTSAKSPIDSRPS
jgi:hypothetical protein